MKRFASWLAIATFSATLIACGGGANTENGTDNGNTETNGDAEAGGIQNATQGVLVPSAEELPGKLKGIWVQTHSDCGALGLECDTVHLSDMAIMGNKIQLGGQLLAMDVSNDTFFVGATRSPVQVMHLTSNELVCNWVADTILIHYEKGKRADQ